MDTPPLELQFPKTLIFLRRRAGFSQRSLAARLGVSGAYIAQLERGRQSVGLKVLAKLAAALGVSPGDLLTPTSKQRSTVRAKDTKTPA